MGTATEIDTDKIVFELEEEEDYRGEVKVKDNDNLYEEIKEKDLGNQTKYQMEMNDENNRKEKGIAGVKNHLTEESDTASETNTEETVLDSKEKENDYEEIKDPEQHHDTEGSKKPEENIYEEIADPINGKNINKQTDFSTQKEGVESKEKDNEYVEIEDPSIEEVEMKRMADEELLCIGNLRAITDRIRRIISGTNKSKNKFVFE